MDYLEKQAKVANGRSSCKNCPIGQINCNENYMKLCTFSFIKGYKAGRRYKYKKKNE